MARWATPRRIAIALCDLEFSILRNRWAIPAVFARVQRSHLQSRYN
ncbi:MAG: hypothetical protein RMX96_00920 [Nostoc sp. ChiSLP02]|nr:hypothetical protein [Nostoc sp. DedSLP05]MDZ8103032.1 hypothetical protein [Nostoc sp. DedSLP01]MDZ8183411.1 hypothetical protein [Nostoc sp. ChiSLP02]